MHLRSTLLFACLAACLPAVHAAPKVPLAAFVQEEPYTNPRLSPDGKYVAVTVRMPIGERFVPVVTFYSLPDMKIAGQIRMPVFEVPLDYAWVSNTRLVIAKGRELGSRERPGSTGEILGTEFDGSKQEYLYGYDNFRASRRGSVYGADHGHGSITDLPRELNGHFFLTSQQWTGNSTQLYDIDARNATRKLMASVPERYMRFVIQRDGKPRFAVGADDDNTLALYRYDDPATDWKRVELGHTRLLPEAFSADDTEFMATYSADGASDSVVKENLATGKRVTLYNEPRGGLGEYLHGAAHTLPFGVSSNIGIPQAHYFDANNEDAKLHKLLSDQFPDGVMSFIDFTKDGKQLLFSVKSDRDPGSYYLFNKATGKAEMLFAAMPLIEPEDMAERRPIHFKARDGLDLYGYLTMPRHAPGVKLPLVLVPHGGPHGPYDAWYFDTDAQFLASRGYAVLQVNFRGSGGRGKRFEGIGYHQWGAKIQDDLVDGVRWAVAQGEVDGNRMCAYGASFGAYSALMLAAREPALFKCAVGYAGLYDLNLVYDLDLTRTEKIALNYWKKVIGEDKAELDRFSPAKLASQITVPVLLVHGGHDKRTPPEQAERMRAALTKESRPPEWLFAPTEGHGFYDTKNVTKFYETLEAFLDKHIGK